jgi:hypothetical protein
VQFGFGVRGESKSPPAAFVMILGQVSSFASYFFFSICDTGMRTILISLASWKI